MNFYLLMMELHNFYNSYHTLEIIGAPMGAGFGLCSCILCLHQCPESIPENMAKRAETNSEKKKKKKASKKNKEM